MISRATHKMIKSSVKSMNLTHICHKHNNSLKTAAAIRRHTTPIASFGTYKKPVLFRIGEAGLCAVAKLCNFFFLQKF